MKKVVDTTTVEDALMAVVMLRPPSLCLQKINIYFPCSFLDTIRATG